MAGAGLGLAGGDDDDGGAAVGVGGGGGLDFHVGIEGGAVGEIEGLALGEVGLNVDEGDFLGGPGLGEGESEAGADGAGANDHDLSGLDGRHGGRDSLHGKG